MKQQAKASEPKERRKSIILSEKTEEARGGEETEVAAQITVPPQGKWKYAVLIASFFCQLLIDGCAFTYGSLMPDVVKSLKIDQSSAALINAVEVAVIFLFSPITSALINRFGFRTIVMAGSMVSSIGLFSAYFCNNFASLLIFQGFLTGVGVSMVSLASLLVVGFYFEKYRNIAMASATCGSSTGVMIMYPINNILVKRSGWRSTILLHAAMHGFTFFLGLVFRPLLSLTVTQTEEEGNPTRTVTFLPTLTNQPGKPDDKNNKKPTAAEKLLHAVSNKNFPTAAAFFNEGDIKPSHQEGPSTSVKAGGVSRITLQAKGAVSKSQLKQMESIVSRMQLKDSQAGAHTEITVQAQEDTNKSWWNRVFNWKSDSPQSRPMYRDDVFYEGKVEQLPAYQKSVANIPVKSRMGLEYQLAVSRAISVNDLNEKRGVCTVSLRRILASMMDPSLLKRKSFILFCLSGFFLYLGVLVPYIFLQDRNTIAGVDATHCSLFISVLSASNLVGRLSLSILASKVEAAYLYSFSLIIAGVATILSDLSYTVLYQYGYVILYGLFISVVSGVRSIVVVKLYGLENLTNATGVILMFIGIGMAISTPLAGAIKKKYGYKYAFYVAGGFITFGGVIFVPIKIISMWETTRHRPPAPKENVLKTA